MDYALWKLFIEAAELGSLSKVAEIHGTSQPHISRQISALENECGGRLLQRTGRGVILTELGQRIAPRVRAWLASTDQLAFDIHTATGKPIGMVRIGILPSTAHPLVTTLYYRLKERCPLVQIRVREGQGAQLDTWLENGSVDIAILFRHGGSPKDGDIYLAETDTYLVSALGDELTSRPTVPFAALHNLPLVTFCRPNSWHERLQQISIEQGVALNVVLEADSLRLQTRLVNDGGIYALLGPYAIADVSTDCRLQSARLVDPVVSRHIALAMSRHGELSLACRAVMQLIKEIVDTTVVDAGKL